MDYRTIARAVGPVSGSHHLKLEAYDSGPDSGPIAKRAHCALYASAVDGDGAIKLAEGDFMADPDWQGDRIVWRFPRGSELVTADSVVSIEL